MAAIMDEWNKIAAHCRKIGDTLGVEVPPILYKVEGDVWARQNQRLSALSAFLQDTVGQVQTLKMLYQSAVTPPLPVSNNSVSGEAQLTEEVSTNKRGRKTTRVLTDV